MRGAGARVRVKLVPVAMFSVAIHQLLRITLFNGYFSPDDVTSAVLSSEKIETGCPGNVLIVQVP